MSRLSCNTLVAIATSLLHSVTIVSCSECQGVLPCILDISRVDELGWTDAHHVAYDRRAFLEDAPDTFLCHQNLFGQTALHLAVRQNALDIVQLYVDRRLPCLSTGNNDGDTPLHYAATWGREEAVKLLLHGGADPNTRNGKGLTPGNDAQHHGYEEMLLLLMVPEEDVKNPSDHQGKCMYRKLLASWFLPLTLTVFIVSLERRRGRKAKKEVRNYG